MVSTLMTAKEKERGDDRPRRSLSSVRRNYCGQSLVILVVGLCTCSVLLNATLLVRQTDTGNAIDSAIVEALALGNSVSLSGSSGSLASQSENETYAPSEQPAAALDYADADADADANQHAESQENDPQPVESIGRSDLDVDINDSGLVGPLDLSDVLKTARLCFDQYQEISEHWKDANLVSKPYVKSPFAYTKPCRQMALHPSLTEQARKIIGTDDIMLASMSPLQKHSGWQHRWHSDVESVVDPSCTNETWTAWIPAWGGSKDSGLHLITHTSNSSIMAQTYLNDIGQKQCKVCQEDSNFDQAGKALLQLAQQRNKHSRLIQIPGLSGQAWFFKGTTFHGSVNRSNKTRVAFQFHFMPTRCRFRRHQMNSDKWPNKSDLLPEMPLVVPLMGDNSTSVFAIPGSKTSKGATEPFPFNNWLLPDFRIPERVYAHFDRTPKLVQSSTQKDPLTSPQIFQLDRDWVNEPCRKKGNAAAGVMDKTKCKVSMLDHSRTSVLRHMEYHATKLRKNTAAHSVRTHEDYELLYLIKGKAVISLTQIGLHESVLYRKEMSAGELAFYPAWQSHGIVAVEEPHSAYIAIRWLGTMSEKPAKSVHVHSWKGLDASKTRSTIETDVSPSQSLNIDVKTVGNPKRNETIALESNTGDTLVLVTRGSILFGEKTVKSPGTLFIPKDELEGSAIIHIHKDSRMVIMAIKPRDEQWNIKARRDFYKDLHYGMPIAATRKIKGIYHTGIVTSADSSDSLVTVQYDADDKVETLDEEYVYFPGDNGMFASRHDTRVESFNASLANTRWKIVVTANLAYEDDLLNWMYHCEKVGLCRQNISRTSAEENTLYADVVLYAQDQALYEKYKNSTKITVEKIWETGTELIDDSKVAHHVTFENYNAFTHIVSQRPALLLHAMEKEREPNNTLFLYVDLDVLLLKDPRPDLHLRMSEGNLDFAAGDCGRRSKSKGCPINSGFVLFRKTGPTLDLFTEWQVALERRSSTIYNQRVLNYLVNTEKKRIGKLKHEVLPRREYPVGKSVKSNDDLNGTIAFHNNYCLKSDGCVKAEKARSLGLWHPLKPEDVLVK